VTQLPMALCDTLGVNLPIVQPPVGSAAAPELVAAVSEAGGLGMLALTWQSPEEARRSIRRVREFTARPFGANLVLDFPVDVLVAQGWEAGGHVRGGTATWPSYRR
jgi:NAD(P)H-dependent flavin oxidoreductase YrpB (nitropropane dioxygenase family)